MYELKNHLKELFKSFFIGIRKKSELLGMSFRPQGEILIVQTVTTERFLASLEMTCNRDITREYLFSRDSAKGEKCYL